MVENKLIKILGYFLVFVLIWAVFSMTYLLVHDNFRQSENKDLYCKKTYGKEFSYPSDAHSNLRICTKVVGDEFIGYYFTKEEQEKYCKESFFKMNDCEEFKE